MSELKRINFNQVASDLGAELPPRRPGPPPNAPKPGDPPPVFTPEMSRQSAIRLANMWPAERALKLFDYFKAEAESGEPLEFEGHPACWAMMALVNYLKNNKLYMYMQPFGKSLELAPFTVADSEPLDGQMVTFETQEQGENVKLTATLTQGGNPNPFQIPFGDTIAPPIASGKNIYVDLVGAHYLAVFSLPWTYPDCKAMFMKMADATYCVVSNTPEYQVGQTVEYPF